MSALVQGQHPGVAQAMYGGKCGMLRLLKAHGAISQQVISSAAESEEVAGSVEDTAGVYFVPAFSGLLAPRWRGDARGALLGLTSYSSKVAVSWRSRTQMPFCGAPVWVQSLAELHGWPVAQACATGNASWIPGCQPQQSCCTRFQAFLS